MIALTIVYSKQTWFDHLNVYFNAKSSFPNIASILVCIALMITHKLQWFMAQYFETENPSGIYLFKVNNKSTRTTSMTYVTFTRKSEMNFLFSLSFFQDG